VCATLANFIHHEIVAAINPLSNIGQRVAAFARSHCTPPLPRYPSLDGASDEPNRDTKTAQDDKSVLQPSGRIGVHDHQDPTYSACKEKGYR
jgi:hypothetical protein